MVSHRTPMDSELPAASTWARIAGVRRPAPPFDPATLDDLPGPARRLLTAALPAGVPLATSVRVAMQGEIRLGPHWTRFTAEQMLVAGVGFVWRPELGGRLLHMTGADAFDAEGASMDFRFQGLVPVVHEEGPSVARSAAGRLAAETVAWLPQALTPQHDARWAPVDDSVAVVTLATPVEDVDVKVTVDRNGSLVGVGLDRWDGSVDPPTYRPFGSSVHADHVTDDGVHIAGMGTVGWMWGTSEQDEGLFFRYAVDSATPVDAQATAGR